MTDRKYTVYLAGPMRGIPDFNFPAFDNARERLRDWGWSVHCPAEKDRQNGFDEVGKAGADHEAKSISEYMKEDLPLVCDSDAVVCLPGWSRSEGAKLEVAVAHRLGKPILLFAPSLAPGDELTLPISEVRIREALALPEIGETPPGFREIVFPELDSTEAKASAAVSRVMNGLVDDIARRRAEEDARLTGEVRTVDPVTGGEKGTKPCQPGLIPPEFMIELGKVYGFGAGKYAPWNWAKGYAWSLSFNALQRHLLSWLDGEELDPESNLSHLAHVAWHAATLYHFTIHHPTGDDRWRTIIQKEHA